MSAPSTARQRLVAGRRAEQDVVRRRGKRGDETVAGWAARWLALRPRQKESTNIAYREQVAPFERAHGAMPLRDVSVERALEWMGEHRWTLGGIRAMFSDARRVGLVDTNPFAGLRLRGSRGRKDIDVLTRGEVDQLAAYAVEVWSGEVVLTIRALILMAGFVGMRPAELYGLRWSDIDIRANEIHVERQYSASTRSFELPKNGKTRTIVLTAPREGWSIRHAPSGRWRGDDLPRQEGRRSDRAHPALLLASGPLPLRQAFDGFLGATALLRLVAVQRPRTARPGRSPPTWPH
jgi:integrase